MLARHIDRTLANIRRRPGRHAATALSLAVAFLAFGAFLVGWWTLDAGVARWGGAYELTVYLSPDADRETLHAMLAAQPEVARATHVDGAAARRRLASVLPEGSGLDDVPADAFPASFELRLRSEARKPAAVKALAARLHEAPGVSSVETYGPWLERLSSLVGLSRAAAVAVGLLVLCVAFVVVGFAARLARSERAAESELLRIVGATPSYIEVPLTLEGAIQGFVGAACACILLASGLAVLRGLVDTALQAPPAWLAALFTAVGALVGALAARRTAVTAS